MLVKIVLLFLVAMASLALIGRLRFPRLPGKQTRQVPATCSDCGRHVIGTTPCLCNKKA